jgi:hypothetical protein
MKLSVYFRNPTALKRTIADHKVLGTMMSVLATTAGFTREYFYKMHLLSFKIINCTPQCV